MNYLDTSFVVALHFSIRGQTTTASHFVRKNSAPFVFSDLAELECRRAHVAQALLTGCTRFLSFDTDSNARVLAASCRLKVFPELTAQEKWRLR